MRKIIVSEFLTLDGVMETPEKWVFEFVNEDILNFKLDEVLAADALLLGYTTYKIFVASWPSRSDPDGFADKMNNMPKYVASASPEKLGWNNSHRIKGNVIDEITKLKKQTGHDILVAGSGMLVQALMQHNLIDEYRLLVYPVVLGKGKRLFQDNIPLTLKLTETKAFDTGVVLLRYEPVKKENAKVNN
jgi:dihydrofolate reductase